MNGIVTYEIRPRKDRRGFDLISDALPFGKLWYDDAEAAANYAEFYSRTKAVEIRFFSDDGEIIKIHNHHGEFERPNLPRFDRMR